jgi:predicted nucleic acid-binding protein
MADGAAPLILDACAIINLAATDQLPAILASTGVPIVVCDTVAAEAHYLRRGGSGDDASERDLIDLNHWVTDGHLTLIQAETDEEFATFVDLAISLDDGEAMTIALAIHRSLVVVTDDRKAIRVASGHVPVETSLALVKRWVESAALDSHDVKTVLTSIRERARYLPHHQHPLRGWWDAIFAEP